MQICILGSRWSNVHCKASYALALVHLPTGIAFVVFLKCYPKNETVVLYFPVSPGLHCPSSRMTAVVGSIPRLAISWKGALHPALEQRLPSNTFSPFPLTMHGLRHTCSTRVHTGLPFGRYFEEKQPGRPNPRLFRDLRGDVT